LALVSGPFFLFFFKNAAMIVQQTKSVIFNEFKSEIKSTQSLAGIGLYVFATIFICYLSFKTIIAVTVWNALFWVIFTFTGINSIAKSFLQNSRGYQIYLYSLVHPVAYILGKTIYNFFLTFLMALFSYILYSVFIKNLVQDNSFFFLALLLGSLGFSSILTMVSAIASKASSNFSLMAILSFPLLIPFLIVLIKFSKNAVDGLDRSISYPLITVLILLFFVVNLLSLVLFPYLWKE